MKLETLLEIKVENERFVKRLEDAIKIAKVGREYGMHPDEVIENVCEYCKEAGALKRSALDLKLVLTKITSPKC